MNKNCDVLRVVGCSFGAALVASLIVVLAGLCLFGFHYAQWAEWQGGIVGVAGTIAGVVGAIFGLRLALRTPRRPETK